MNADGLNITRERRSSQQWRIGLVTYELLALHSASFCWAQRKRQEPMRHRHILGAVEGARACEQASHVR
jgi:hypothetical protein